MSYETARLADIPRERERKSSPPDLVIFLYPSESFSRRMDVAIIRQTDDSSLFSQTPDCADLRAVRQASRGRSVVQFEFSIWILRGCGGGGLRFAEPSRYRVPVGTIRRQQVEVPPHHISTPSSSYGTDTEREASSRPTMIPCQHGSSVFYFYSAAGPIHSSRSHTLSVASDVAGNGVVAQR